MSSLFQNENLINSLIAASIKHIEKYGAEPNSLNYDAYELAQKMIIDLKRQIDPENAPPVEAPIGTPNGQPLNLTDRELRNLGDFINWAATNKLTWNNKRFAWTEAEYKANPSSIPNDAAEFSAYTSTRDRETDTRKPHKVAAYALKQELIDFVTYIRDSEQNRKNRVLQVMIGSLINQINENLEPGDKKIDPRPPKDAGFVLSPTMIVDGLPPVLNVENPLEDINGWNNNFIQSNTKLSVQTINTAFRAWVLNITIKNKDKQTLVSDAVNGDPCLAINMLYKRAQYLVNTVGDAHDQRMPGYSKAAKLYLDKIVEVGKTFRGKDGKACTIGDVGTTGTTGTTTPGTTTPGGQTPLTPQQIALLQQILSNLPLHTANIDTNRIDRFLTALAQFDQGTKTSALTQNIAYREVQRIMGAMDGLMIGQYPQINLTMNLQSVEGLLKNGWKDASAFIDNLRQLVIQTSAMLSALNSTWGYAMSPGQKQKVEAQTNYIGNDNISKINSWASALSRSVKVK